jgi:hypothetical protein
VPVVKVAVGEVDAVPLLFAETTSKVYAVLGVRPVRVTKCAVVRVALSVDDKPKLEFVP